MKEVKRATICFLIGLVLFNLISSCAKGQSKGRDIKVAARSKNVLIVYLSRTNNTKAIAQIQKDVGGALIALELVNPYPENYKAIVEQVAEENATGFLPPLKTKIDSIQRYNIVFVAFPTWGMQLPALPFFVLSDLNLK